MAVENRVDIVYTDETIQAANTAISGLQEVLKPYLIAIPSDKKKNMVIIGDRLFDFIEKGIGLAKSNPDLIPPYLKMEEVTKDVEAWKVMTPMIKELEQQISLLSDTAGMCGNEAYSAILSFYHYIKQAAKDGVPGAKTIYEDLKTQFPSTVQKKSSDTADTSTEE